MNPNRILFLLLVTWYSFAQQKDVASLNYEQLKPLLFQKSERVQVINFWATWCAPCIKELPYFEKLNQRDDVEVLLVSLDFPKHKQKRLLPFIEKYKIRSKVVHLDDANETFWINQISTKWSGALPATLIYNNNRRGFYEQSFTKEELYAEVNSYF